ncbi:MAG: hypothetical protein P8179_12095 [Candidatus Thiodiazotropha sp.]|jgi:hypothetical protein
MTTNIKKAVLVSRIHYLIIIMCMVIGCAASKEGVHWKSVAMANGSLEIRFETSFGFGPHTLFFYFDREGEFQLLKAIMLRNDGANLNDHNIEIKNLEQGQWRITLKGEEQADEHWLVEAGEKEVTMIQTE